MQKLSLDEQLPRQAVSCGGLPPSSSTPLSSAQLVTIFQLVPLRDQPDNQPALTPFVALCEAVTMALLLLALLASLQVLSQAEPIPSPTKAAATKTAAISAGPITLAPGYTVTSTVIAGQTYPIFSVGVQGGYQLTATSFSASGLLGITLANVYSTLPDGQVYPAFEVYVNEADSELFTIPGVLTFRDGGVSTDGPQPTDVKCSLGLSGGGCSDLAGLVTGTVFGEPFTAVGGSVFHPHTAAASVY